MTPLINGYAVSMLPLTPAWWVVSLTPLTKRLFQISSPTAQLQNKHFKPNLLAE
jgi:hypothetical protein